MSYATVEEFMQRLSITTPTADQLERGQQALNAATQEIDAYLDWLEDPPVLTDDQAALVVTVNLDRAGEHWRYTPYGALNQGPDLPPVLTARDSWYRHTRKLASLKTNWGVG